MAPGPDSLSIREPRTLTTVWFRGRWRSWPPNPATLVTRRRQTETSTGCFRMSSLVAGFVRGDRRSALSQRWSQDQRDAEGGAALEGPSRSAGRGCWIASDLGKVSTDAVHQLGMQVPGGRAHAGAAPNGRVGDVRMRVVILCSSPYSETGCAVAARLAQVGYAPVGGLTLPSWDRGTLLRKDAEW